MTAKHSLPGHPLTDGICRVSSSCVLSSAAQRSCCAAGVGVPALGQGMEVGRGQHTNTRPAHMQQSEPPPVPGRTQSHSPGAPVTVSPGPAPRETHSDKEPGTSPSPREDASGSGAKCDLLLFCHHLWGSSSFTFIKHSPFPLCEMPTHAFYLFPWGCPF